jgi:hypothetical protein
MNERDGNNVCVIELFLEGAAKAAKECSPWHKPWEEVRIYRQAPKGERKILDEERLVEALLVSRPSREAAACESRHASAGVKMQQPAEVPQGRRATGP